MSAFAGYLAAATTVQAPSVEYGTLAPFFALAGGSIVVLLLSLVRGGFVQRVLLPGLTLVALAIAGDQFVRRIGDPDLSVLSGALRVDDLAAVFGLIFIAAAAFTVLLAWRSRTVEDAGRGEFYGLLLAAVTGMAMLAAAQNLVTFFVAFELFSIPLYVLCASDLRREGSLEAGLKYLIIGSLGSATLLYGLALIYGATGSTDFNAIGAALAKGSVASDPLLLVGVALALAGLAFKASVAPFHQWTPDVYEGAPTPVTTFMAVATKAAAIAILLRFTGQALHDVRDQWVPVLAALAAVTIFVGNVGALRQESIKRMLAYSGVGQAGYLLAGVVVGTELGAQATIFYLFVYLLMNVGAFAVVVARERSGADDSLASLRRLGRESPVLAWSMTICMIALAGLPVTGGFIGKFFLVQASIEGDYAWLAVAIVLGSVISLGYYLRVVAAIWLDPERSVLRDDEAEIAAAVPAAIAGASPEADARAHWELVAVAAACALAVVAVGFYPGPLFDVAQDAARAWLALT